MIEWQAPKTRKQLQSFLGFANFYWQFIPSFAGVALPLTDLLCTKQNMTKPQPGQVVEWTSVCQKAFEKLKEMFACEPVLKHLNQSLPFVIQADMNDVAVGAVLLQRHNQMRLQPYAYTSQTFTATKRGWAI